MSLNLNEALGVIITVSIIVAGVAFLFAKVKQTTTDLIAKRRDELDKTTAGLIDSLQKEVEILKSDRAMDKINIDYLTKEMEKIKNKYTDLGIIFTDAMVGYLEKNPHKFEDWVKKYVPETSFLKIKT